MRLVAYQAALVMLLSMTGFVFATSETFSYGEGINIPCGRVEEIKLSTKADFELKWDVPKFKEEPTLQAGESFIEVIVVVDATTGMRSIGKHDYSLSRQPCLAMGEGDGAYDPLNREYTVDSKQQKMKTVKLLFKGNKANAPFTLSFNYDEVDGFDPALTAVTLDLVKAPARPDPAEMMIKPKGAGGSSSTKKKAGSSKKKTSSKKKPSRVPKEEW